MGGMRKLAALAFALSSLALFAERDMAIYRGKLTSDLNANGNRITSVDLPLDAGDAANKEYVDAHGGCDTNAVDILANSAVVTNALTVATTNRVAALETHVENTDNPHAVTAEQVGAVPFVADKYGNKTAVTIGSRIHGGEIGERSLANGNEVIASGYFSHAEGDSTTASGNYSHAEGSYTTASGPYSHAEGSYTTASGLCSHAEGYLSQTKEDDIYAFAWNGDDSKTEEDPYKSNGPGTFNINPLGGLDGFYIGEQTLAAILLGSVTNKISATNPTFSNAVLAVGLNIDTNSVAVLNEIADTFGGFPIGGTATTVGGLLAALAAAAAWLKKNKVGSFASVGGATATVENGVAKLDDFFTNSNSLLTGLIASETSGKADKGDLYALAAKVDAANAALEDVA